MRNPLALMREGVVFLFVFAVFVLVDVDVFIVGRVNLDTLFGVFGQLFLTFSHDYERYHNRRGYHYKSARAHADYETDFCARRQALEPGLFRFGIRLQIGRL